MRTLTVPTAGGKEVRRDHTTDTKRQKMFRLDVKVELKKKQEKPGQLTKVRKLSKLTHIFQDSASNAERIIPSRVAS